MKAELHFDLNDPEDRRRHREVMASEDMVAVLQAIAMGIRNVRNHGELSDESHRAVAEVEDSFIEIIGDAEILWVLG